MKKIKKIIAVALGLCLALMCFTLVACGETEKTVKSVKVTTAPAKLEYNVGDTVDFSDGVITVTYDDGTPDTKKFTDEGVEVSEDCTTINDETEDSEEKTVTVRYGGKRATFKITVSHAMLTVTFDYGYAGATPAASSVRKNATLAKPTDPTRENHTFENWYDDSVLTVLHDFTAPVTDNKTVYAKWLENGATYFDVTFDYNYSGAVNPAPQKVKSGEKATKISVDPTREGYAFEGWCSDKSGNNAYSFDTAVTAATTVFAKWRRTSTGAAEYVFEAEDTDLTGKSGPGLSGRAPGTAMIQFSDKLGASNNRFIGYQYDETCTLEFQFVSDMAVEDAKIVLRLSAEMRDYDMNPDNYYVMLNGNPIAYSEIKFVNVPKASSDDVGEVNALEFKDFVLVENAKLKEGLNTIQLQTANDHPLEGTTVLSDAPLIDCLKITTSAVLSWSEAHGLPKKGNY